MDLMSSSSVKCCDCGCSCGVSSSSRTDGVWIRSVKRKYDEFELSNRFYIPGLGLDALPVARVGVEHECALLRETVSSQQDNIHDLCLELEEERDASSSAAEEAMSMILRLQREKAEVQMEARQFKRFSEEKMSHDAQEIVSLEEELYKREQAMQSLSCEVQAYKHRMMSFGLTESEAEGLKGGYSRNTSFYSEMADTIDSPTCSYPQLRCNVNGSQWHSELDDEAVDVEKYPFGETPRIQDLKKLEHRINQLEKTPRGDHRNGDSRNVLEKVIVGCSPRRTRNSRYSTESQGSLLGPSRDMGPDYAMDSPMWGTSVKKLDIVTEELRKSDSGSDYEDDMSDRVYTIDSVHSGVPYNSFSEPKVSAKHCEDQYVSTPQGNHVDIGDPDVKKLYLRLQNLEADRESMRQAIISMQTDKAQIVLLREIAQQFCKSMTPKKSMPPKNPSTVKKFSLLSVLKSLISWKKKIRQSKYMSDMTANNRGLLLLLDKTPRKLSRCVSSAHAHN